jgi:paraquat-inducible protein B
VSAAAATERGKPRWRSFRFVWVVPLIALVVAGKIVVERLQEYGPEVTIRFSDGAGLRVGQTPLKFRGVQIGEVTGVQLSPDQKQVLVKVRLSQSSAKIAAEGAVFWIVRPQLAGAAVIGLGTVLTGPEIQVLPGTGAPRKEFTGLENAPVALEVPGLEVVLRAPRLKSLLPNTPVYYRGVEVGVVRKVDVSPEAAAADVHVLIRQRYAGLVRSGSVFWNSSGANLSGGLFKGVKLEIESLRSLLAGGIEFASPPQSAPAKPGARFVLHDAPQPEWLAWAPGITLPPAD